MTSKSKFGRNLKGLEFKYFVLKPPGKSPYAKASRAALQTYAASIRTINPILSEDIRVWVEKELKNGK